MPAHRLRITSSASGRAGYFKHTTVYTKIALPAGSHTFGVAAPSQDASRDSVYNLIDFTFNKAFPLATSGQQEFYATDFLGQSSYITVKDAYLDDVIPMDENEVYGLTKGRWVDYEIEVPRVGSYDITLYQKSEKENQALKLFLDGDDANPIATFKNTKTGTYEKVTATATLPVGNHRIRVRCDDTDGVCSFVSLTFRAGERLPLTITGAEKDGEGRITGITFVNPANVAVPAKLILASYQNGAAASIYTESITIPASGGTVRLAGGPVECSGQLKCMLWDSLTGMRDLAQSYLIP